MTGPELSLYVTFDATLGKAGTSIALLRITTRLGSGTGMETLVLHFCDFGSLWILCNEEIEVWGPGRPNFGCVVRIEYLCLTKTDLGGKIPRYCD